MGKEDFASIYIDVYSEGLSGEDLIWYETIGEVLDNIHNNFLEHQRDKEFEKELEILNELSKDLLG